MEKTSQMMRFEQGGGITVHWAVEEGNGKMKEEIAGAKALGFAQASRDTAGQWP